ncbi:MAG: hypothetical protein IM562_05910 [Chitinophagaceae bacterium]|jgi:hypothetical protein|nr:hypothetical protein [Chitinophagaceae bacterium]
MSYQSIPLFLQTTQLIIYMNNIITIDPERILQNSSSKIFFIVWTNSKGTFFCTGNGNFQNAADGGAIDSPAIMRNNAIQQYYQLVNIAKSHPLLKDGRIDLLPLPTI